jgi:hypothetical protein
MMLTHYLNCFAAGFNDFVARLLAILNAAATHNHGAAA